MANDIPQPPSKENHRAVNGVGENGVVGASASRLIAEMVESNVNLGPVNYSTVF